MTASGAFEASSIPQFGSYNDPTSVMPCLIKFDANIHFLVCSLSMVSFSFYGRVCCLYPIIILIQLLFYILSIRQLWLTFFQGYNIALARSSYRNE